METYSTYLNKRQSRRQKISYKRWAATEYQKQIRAVELAKWYRKECHTCRTWHLLWPRPFPLIEVERQLLLQCDDRSLCSSLANTFPWKAGHKTTYSWCQSFLAHALSKITWSRPMTISLQQPWLWLNSSWNLPVLQHLKLQKLAQGRSLHFLPDPVSFSLM